MFALTHACLALALAGGPADPSAAQTDTTAATAIPRGSRRSFLAVHIGGSRPIRSPEYDSHVGGGSVLLEESIGAVLGRDTSGLALSLVLQQSFGPDANTYAIAPRFAYEIPLSEHYGVYLTPSLTFGYRMLVGGGVNDPTRLEDLEPIHQATIQLGLAAKVILVDRVVLSFRPIGLDLAVPHIEGSDPIVGVRWQVLGGLGFTF